MSNKTRAPYHNDRCAFCGGPGNAIQGHLDPSRGYLAADAVAAGFKMKAPGSRAMHASCRGLVRLRLSERSMRDQERDQVAAAWGSARWFAEQGSPEAALEALAAAGVELDRETREDVYAVADRHGTPEGC